MNDHADRLEAISLLHSPYTWSVPEAYGGPKTFTVCRECSEPDDWDVGGPYLYPDVHLVDWPCATVRLAADPDESLTV